MSKVNIGVKTNVVFDIQTNFCPMKLNGKRAQKKRFVKVSEKDPVQNYGFLGMDLNCSMYSV